MATTKVALLPVVVDVSAGKETTNIRISIGDMLADMLKQKSDMLKDLLGIFSNVFLRYKTVKSFSYKDITLFNQQGSDEMFQVLVEDSPFFELNITNQIFKASYEIYILSTPSKDESSILNVQDTAFDIAVNVIEFFDNKFKGVMNVYDYSILLLSHFTDNDSAGVKLSIVLQVPNPVDLCRYEENFNDEPYEKPEDDKPIDLPEKIDKKISLKKTKLPSTPSKC